MRYFSLLFIFIVSVFFSDAQPFGKSVESTYPDTLQAPDDSFKIRFIYSSVPDEDIYTRAVSYSDTTDMGTDGSIDLKVAIYTTRDTLTIPYTNLPYAQVLYIPIVSPKGKTMYRLHFNSTISAYSREYIASHNNSVEFEIPEAYELANIIWILSAKGIKTTNIDTNGVYYKKVKAYFRPYMNHPVFGNFAFHDSLNSNKYYDFRENSYTFSFKVNGGASKLVYEGPYYYVMGDDWDNYTSMFKDLLPLIEDFAKQSKYRSFYKSNISYYKKLIKRQEELMPVRKMWAWLEKEFPGRKFNSYKIVFSPLITGSHSTQNFGDYSDGKVFWEAIMFVCGPESLDADTLLTEQQKEGLHSGIVFTEIDHNYVNPASNNYRKKIDSAFANRSTWVEKDKANWYGNPLSVFNEYMTHAAFCLYIAENYDAKTAAYVIQRRVSLMVNRRGFTRFKEYNEALMSIRNNNKDKQVADLYPEIIAWCNSQR